MKHTFHKCINRLIFYFVSQWIGQSNIKASFVHDEEGRRKKLVNLLKFNITWHDNNINLKMTLRDDVPSDSAPPAGNESFKNLRRCSLLYSLTWHYTTLFCSITSARVDLLTQLQLPGWNTALQRDSLSSPDISKPPRDFPFSARLTETSFTLNISETYFFNPFLMCFLAILKMNKLNI